MNLKAMRPGFEVMPIATARDESFRRETALRILVLDASPSCSFDITTANGIGDSIERVEITEATRAEFQQHAPEDWDIVITHVHQASIDAAARTPAKVVSLRAATLRGWRRTLHRLFHRDNLSPIEQEEQRATQTMVLAEMQRQIGVALSAIEMGDFDTIGEIACRLRDDATNYDFARLSGLGAALNDTVPSRDIRTARNIAQKLMTYMGKTFGYYLA